MLGIGARRIPRALVNSANPETRRKQRKLNTRQKGEVKRIVRFGRELKFFNRQVGPLQSVSTTPGILDLSNMVQGNRDTERNGDRIELAGSMDVILQVVGSETTIANADIYNTLRIVFFQYKDSAVSGVNPIASQIFLPGPGGVGPDVFSLYNHDERQNYTILYDKQVTCINNSNPAAGTSGTNYQGNHVHNYKFKVSLKRAKKLVQYVGGGTDGTNKIYFYIVSDSVAPPHPTYTLNCKLYYRDG